jgi:hypothetical protein
VTDSMTADESKATHYFSEAGRGASLLSAAGFSEWINGSMDKPPDPAAVVGPVDQFPNRRFPGLRRVAPGGRRVCT